MFALTDELISFGLLKLTMLYEPNYFAAIMEGPVLYHSTSPAGFSQPKYKRRPIS